MPRELPVREIMSTEVLTLSPDMSVEDAVRALAARGISGAPVVDATGRVIGLVDDSDLVLAESRVHGPSLVEILGAYIPLPGSLSRFEKEVRHALAGTVEDLMTPDPPRLGPDATVEDVATLMTERELSRVPVVDADDRLIGIVSRGDLVIAMARGEAED